jgi:type III restriction enzyme
MTELHEALAQRVADWRAQGYPHDKFPAVGEILQYAVEGEEEGAPFPQSGNLRFLRVPQLRALETYWFLRVVENTPHVGDLYTRLFERTADRLSALGLDAPALKDIALDIGYDGLIDRIRIDDDFVREHRLEATRETLTLDYPSYILALAMGAGKTILIGAIIATEFALAIEYPDAGFIENALVFAPGTTIIESLRELARIPYERILPARLHEPFAAALKMTFTRDGERDIPVTRGSSFNLVVTNTEKIRIQARPVRRQAAGFRQLQALEDEAREVANLRLQAIASLPHLGIFSDEAHHTYGHSLGSLCATWSFGTDLARASVTASSRKSPATFSPSRSRLTRRMSSSPTSLPTSSPTTAT